MRNDLELLKVVVDFSIDESAIWGICCGNMFYVYFCFELVPKQIDDHLQYCLRNIYCQLRTGFRIKSPDQFANLCEICDHWQIHDMHIHKLHWITNRYAFNFCMKKHSHVVMLLWYSHDTHAGKLPCSNMRVVNVYSSRQDLSISPYHMGGWSPLQLLRLENFWPLDFIFKILTHDYPKHV